MKTRQFVSPLLFSICLVMAGSLAFAQSNNLAGPANSNSAQQSKKPVVQLPPLESVTTVAGRSTLYCAGYVRFEKFSRAPEIVGAVEEQMQRTFSTGDVVYLNWGAQDGIKEGQELQIIRPRGDVKSVYHQKKGFLGVYVEEVGQLRVFKVREHTSAAQITFSCASVLLGDLLTVIPNRQVPLEKPETGLDLFADPTGKQKGRLMMAHDGREMLTKRDVVYIDLGAEDNVNPGDYLTIYRPLGTGNLTQIEVPEGARGRLDGFGSDRYRGGGFGIQAQRAKDYNSSRQPDGHYNGNPIITREVKRQRPEMPRKIVGEMVIIDVQSRTATAIITQVAGEVHTGDWVEVK